MASDFGGYMGKIVAIDLTDETITEYPWTDCQRERYIGGKVMALAILSELLDGSEKAFSEENPVIISTGPLTGTGAPSSVRFDITAISPQSGLPASSNCGGSFGLYLKQAGYDAIILTGRCKERRWLDISDDRIAFHDAAPLWGSCAQACQDALTEQLGTKQFGRLCIGPAGENLVSYAAVTGDNRAAGRSGIGAVLGWKQLKAITVRGTAQVPVHAPEQAKQINKEWFSYLHAHPLTGGASPNNTGSCLGCPIACGKQGKDDKTVALEALCPSGDPMPDFARLLNELGMDTIASADAIAWAVEAEKQGVINGCISLSSSADLTALLEDIACCRGFGSELAQGEKRLSKKYGFRRPKGKGGHDGNRRSAGHGAILEAFGLTRLSPSLAMDTAILFYDLTEAVSAFGQCMFSANACCPPHLLAAPKSFRSVCTRRFMPLLAPLIRLVTRYPRILCCHLSFLHHTAMLAHVTGMKMSFGRCIEVGRRGHTLERLLALRFGSDRVSLPKSLPKDDSVREHYCRARGWDKTGIPSQKALRRLRILP